MTTTTPTLEKRVGSTKFHKPLGGRRWYATCIRPNCDWEEYSDEPYISAVLWAKARNHRFECHKEND